MRAPATIPIRFDYLPLPSPCVPIYHRLTWLGGTERKRFADCQSQETLQVTLRPRQSEAALPSTNQRTNVPSPIRGLRWNSDLTGRSFGAWGAGSGRKAGPAGGGPDGHWRLARLRGLWAGRGEEPPEPPGPPPPGSEGCDIPLPPRLSRTETRAQPEPGPGPEVSDIQGCDYGLHSQGVMLLGPFSELYKEVMLENSQKPAVPGSRTFTTEHDNGSYRM
ncbi:uncharacterized protein LOC141508978 [Macrotis lagotis]|uniref:uncharacterized protein LOC141508978 n=1 Tax=Macrotis lagotis TaxID=92651 RepID=UPI003D686479